MDAYDRANYGEDDPCFTSQSLDMVGDARRAWNAQAEAINETLLVHDSHSLAGGYEMKLPMELRWVPCSRCPHKVQTPLPLGIITRQALEKIGWKLIDLQPVCSQHFADSEVF